MKKKPPSRVRYEQNNPVVSARIDKTTHDKLREMLRAEGKTFAKFLKEVINEAKKKWKKAYRAGYTRGREEWQIWYYCARCGEKLFMRPNGKDHQAMIKHMRSEGWAHGECLEWQRKIM